MSNTTTPPQLAAIVAAGLFALSLTGCQKDKGTPAPGELAATTQAPAPSPSAGSPGETATGKNANEREVEKWKSAILGDAGTRAKAEAECKDVGMEMTNFLMSGADLSSEKMESLWRPQCDALFLVLDIEDNARRRQRAKDAALRRNAGASADR